MFKVHWMCLPLLMSAGAGFAATLSDMEKAAVEGGIVMTTDPSVASEVERRAMELAARQHEQTMAATGTAGTGAASQPAQSRPQWT